MKSRMVKQCINANHNDTHASRAVVVEQIVCLLLISLDVYVIVSLCLEAGNVADIVPRFAHPSQLGSRSLHGHGSMPSLACVSSYSLHGV